MAQNYDLTQTGPELQERIDQVFPNRDNIAAENVRAEGAEGDLETRKADRTELIAETERAQEAEQGLRNYTDAETARAAGVENGLQRQIDEIVSGSNTVNLTVSPAAVFADGEDKTVTFTATSTPKKATVTFKEKGSGGEGETVENVNTHPFPVTVNSQSQTTKTYQAAFTVQGVSKGTKEASVKLVYPVYVGAGVDYADGDFTVQTARTSPAGTYNITTEAGDHLLFDVPSGMSITKVLLYDDPAFPSEVAVETIASGRTGLDGSAYTCYQSVGTFAAGTHAYKVS